MVTLFDTNLPALLCKSSYSYANQYFSRSISMGRGWWEGLSCTFDGNYNRNFMELEQTFHESRKVQRLFFFYFSPI